MQPRKKRTCVRLWCALLLAWLTHGRANAQSEPPNSTSTQQTCDANWSPRFDSLASNPAGMRAAIHQKLDRLIAQNGGLDGTIRELESKIKSDRERKDLSAERRQSLISMNQGIIEIFRCRQSGSQPAAAMPQQDRSSPTNSTDKGPSLEITMQFIQDKLNDIGPVKWVEYYHDKVKNSDWTNKFGAEIKDFVALPKDCRITYRKFSGNLQLGLTEMDYKLQLKDVANILIVSQLEDQRNTFAAATNGDFNNWLVTSVAPPIFILRVITEHPVEFEAPKFKKEQFLPIKRIEFEFLDEKLADRVAKALQHASELCGAASKSEPF
jgi:hypothetical protein